LASGTADDPRRPTVVFDAGHPDSADIEGHVRLALCQTEELIGSIINLLGSPWRFPTTPPSAGEPERWMCRRGDPAVGLIASPCTCWWTAPG
jgi:hypothetical protein